MTYRGRTIHVKALHISLNFQIQEFNLGLIVVVKVYVGCIYQMYTSNVFIRIHKIDTFKIGGSKHDITFRVMKGVVGCKSNPPDIRKHSVVMTSLERSSCYLKQIALILVYFVPNVRS